MVSSTTLVKHCCWPAKACLKRIRKRRLCYGLSVRYLAACVLACLGCFALAQNTRQIYTGASGSGIFNLAVNDPVLLGEEAFTISLYESDSTMQLRRTPYSRVSYAYAGVDVTGTLHLQRRFIWQDRGIDSLMDVHLKLETTLAFGTGFGGPPAELVFREGRGGKLLISVVNDPPLERPKNEGF